jgi:hypothetical protein
VQVVWITDTPKMRTVVACVAAVSLAVSGCSPQLDLPDDITILCSTNADCPAGLVCHDSGFCIAEGQPFPPAVSLGVMERDVGDALVDVTVTDSNSDPVTLQVEYSIAGGTFAAATTDLAAPIAATPSGTPAHITWYAETDLGTAYTADILLRVTPSDASSEGEPGESNVFDWGNDGPEIRALTLDVGPGNTVEGPVVLRFELVDRASDTIDVTGVELSLLGDFSDAVALPLATGFGQMFRVRLPQLDAGRRHAASLHHLQVRAFSVPA